MGPVDELGLLKMDFLGLSNLTIIKNCLRIIKKVYSKEIDLNTLPLEDEETFRLFQRGDTTGVFQLESAGMKRYLKELKLEHKVLLPYKKLSKIFKIKRLIFFNLFAN